MMAGKYPSMFEKLCAGMLGLILNCLFVRFVSSIAVINPKIVTSRALSFSVVGIVMIGVFVGKKLEVMMSPAMMLPHASRLSGFSTAGLFSLIGESGRNRG